MMREFAAGVLVLFAVGAARAQSCTIHECEKLYAPTPNTEERFGREIILDGDRLYIAESSGLFVHVYQCGTDVNEYLGAIENEDAEYPDARSVTIDGSTMLTIWSEVDSRPLRKGVIYDVSDMARPIVLSEITGPNEPVHGQPAYSFGNNIAMDSSTAAIAAPNLLASQGNNYSGGVYLYDIRDPSSPVFRFMITAPTPRANGQFGKSLALRGNLLAVGAPGQVGASGFQEGAVYLFDLTHLNRAFPPYVSLIKEIRSSDSSRQDLFGEQIDLDGDRLAVLAFDEDTHGSGRGSIYVYDISDPANPVESEIAYNGSGEAPSLWWELDLDGDSLYAAAHGAAGDTVIRFDLGGPGGPTEVARYEASDGFLGRLGSFEQMEACGGTVYAGFPWDGTQHYKAGTVYMFSADSTGVCKGDATGDCVVDVNDISFVLFRLSNSGIPGELEGDANGDGTVDVNDISYVLFRLGDSC